MTKVRRAKLAEVAPDQDNANRGTERGQAVLNHSLRQYGAGRSILLDRDGRIIAGNKTAEVAADIGLDEVIVVETDGRELVAVQRTDLDLEEDPAARELAYADNRAGEVGLEWDASQILADLEEGVNLDALFYENELEALLASQLVQPAAPDTRTNRISPFMKAKVRAVLYAPEIALFERALAATGQKQRGEALIEICRQYLREVGDDIGAEAGQFEFGPENLA